MSKNKADKKTKAVKVKAAPAPKPEVEKGSWQEALTKSAGLLVKSEKDRKRASTMLWDGAKAGIENWLPGTDDENAEQFAGEVLDLLGKERKGDASKIKTVALAAKNNGLDLDAQPNLSKAYAEARRLTQTVVQHSEEDEAAEEVIANIDAPKTATTAEGAAKIVLAKGVDEAARLLLDALGDQNHAAHRSLLRAVSEEVGGRVRAEKEAEVEARKAEAAKKKADREARAAAKAAEKAAEKKAAVTPKAKAPKAVAKASTKAKPKAAKNTEAPTAEPLPEVDADVPTTPEVIEGEKAKKPVRKPIIKKPTPVKA